MANKSAENDLVSVITPTYNRARYLPHAIRSVLQQTHENFEYFIIDDGSTDNTRQVVDQYLKDPRVHYRYQTHQGQSIARNLGLSLANGMYICFLDSDDVWVLDKLESELQFLADESNVDIVYGERQYIDEHGNYLPTPDRKRYSGFITEALLNENCVPFDTNMVRRRCFDEMGGLDESLKQSDDYDLWLRFSTRFRFHYQPKVTTLVRLSESQLSQDKEARFAAVKCILDRFLKQYGQVVGESVRKRTMSRYHVKIGRYWASKGGYILALRDYCLAVRYCPLSQAPWRGIARVLLLWK